MVSVGEHGLALSLNIDGSSHGETILVGGELSELVCYTESTPVLAICELFGLTVELGLLELPAGDLLLEHPLDLGGRSVAGLGQVEEKVCEEDDVEAEEEETRLGAPVPADYRQ